MIGDAKPNLLRPRWSKVVSDLWDDRTRTALVIISIMVGIFAIGMVISAYAILQEDINRGFAAVNPANIVVHTDPFDEELVQAIAKIPGVEDVQGRRVIGVRARRGDEDWLNLALVGIEEYPSAISRLKAIAGATEPGKDEVVISQDMIRITGFQPGDTIEVELPDGADHTLLVTGLVADQTAALADPNATNYAFVTLKTLQSFGLDNAYNRLFVTVAGEGSDGDLISRIATEVEDKAERSQRQVYRVEQTLSNEHPMADTVLAILGMLGAIGVLIAILSSSLIINTLNAMLTQQRRQIGVMKLVGGRSRQIMGMYLLLIVAYGLIALVVAAPLGAVAGYGLASLIAYLTGAALQGFRIIPVAIIAQVLIAFLIPLGAGFWPVRNGARTSVRQAISNYRPDSTGQSTGDRLLNRTLQWFRWLSRPILLSFRNTFRKKGRLALTMFTLTMAGAVFIAVFAVRDSLDDVLDQLLQHFLGDVMVEFSRPYRVSEVEYALLEIPGIEGVEGWTAASGEIWNANDEPVTNLSIVAPPQDTQLLNLEMRSGRWLLPGEERALVVSDTIYQTFPEIKAGDSLMVKLPGRDVEPWTVVGIYSFLALFGDPMGYANFEFIADRNGSRNETASYRIVTEAHDAASQQALSQQITGLLEDRKFAVHDVEAGYDMQRKAALALNTVIIFLLMMAVLTALVGSIGLTGAMSINVLERTREIGVMRTIGAGDMVIIRSVAIEALVIGLITWAQAIVLSFPIAFLLLRIIGEAIMDAPLALNFTPFGILLWLGVVIVLSILASILPARRAARLTINEVLAYE